MRIDSHHHLWAINDTDYVWMGDEHAVIRRDFLPADLQTAARRVRDRRQRRRPGPPDEWRKPNGCLALRTRTNGSAAWSAGCRCWRTPASHCSNEFASHPKLRAVRHVVHDEPDDDFILRPDFNEGIRRLAKYGLVYDILIFWKHLPQTVRFVDQHPAQPFVVDHIAKPRISRDAFDEEWATGIRELARREHVSCKVSGMLTEVRDAEWDAELLRPYFDTVFEAFGPQRVMYGSDWPVCLLRDGYAVWAETAGTLAASLSSDEQAAFWGENATRIYRL